MEIVAPHREGSICSVVTRRVCGCPSQSNRKAEGRGQGPRADACKIKGDKAHNTTADVESRTA